MHYSDETIITFAMVKHLFSFIEDGNIRTNEYKTCGNYLF